MASIAFPSISKTTRVPNGTTYNYVHVPPKDGKPYILFLHGFPGASYDWRHQIPYFSNLGYGLVVPDLLGYGGTDKPEELEAYRLKKMSDEVAGILDANKIDQVIGVGHDWGSNLLARFVNYHPNRILKLAFLDVGYSRGGPVSIDAINEMSEKAIGYPIFGYWHFFNDLDAGPLMDKNPESVNSLLFAADPTFLKTHMCHLGSTRAYFETSTTGPLASWATPSEIALRQKIFSRNNGDQGGGYTAPLRWYKAHIANLNARDEEAWLGEEEKLQVKQQTLLVTCSKDFIAVPKLQEERMRPFVSRLEVREVESGHWVQIERKEEVNRLLEGFFA